LGQELGDLLGEVRVTLASDQPLAHNHRIAQILHHRQVQRWLIVIKLRHYVGAQLRLERQRIALDPRALGRKRPRFADQPDVGQRLLNDHRPCSVARADDSEDQVQIAVANLFAQQRLARR
jgi:hypothetical protein